jgi:K+-transporting ATPase A subunit
MSTHGWLQFLLFSIVLLASVRPVGIYMARVFEGERTWLDPVLRPIEKLLYKLSGVNAEREMNWRQYAFAMLGFAAVSLVITFVMSGRNNGCLGIRGDWLRSRRTWHGIPLSALQPIRTGNRIRRKRR